MDQVYINQESKRLSQIMYDNPHAAAEELREELRTIPSDAAVALIRQTKVEETKYGSGGLGDLQIQVELDQRGCDSGYRNVIIATPEGPEQIAEFQSGAPICYDDNGTFDQSSRPDPLLSITTMIIGNYIWQQQHNLLRDDSYYHGWHHRQQMRENHWQHHHGEWQNWHNQDFRRNIQQQDWQQFAWQPRWYQGQDNVQRYYQQQPKQYYPQDGHDYRQGHGLPTPDGEWHGHGHRHQGKQQRYWQQGEDGQAYYPGQIHSQQENLLKQQEALRLQKQEQERLLRQQQGLIPAPGNEKTIVPGNQPENQYWRQGHHDRRHSAGQDVQPNIGQGLYPEQTPGNQHRHRQETDIQDKAAAQQQLLQQRQLEAQRQKEAARQQQQEELIQQRQQEVLQRQQEEAAKRQQQQLLQERQQEALQHQQEEAVKRQQQQLLQQRQQEALQHQQEEAAKRQRQPQQQFQQRQPEPVNPQLDRHDEQQQTQPGNNAHRYQGGRHGLKM